MIHLTFAAQNIGLHHYLNKLIQVVCIAVQGILSHMVPICQTSKNASYKTPRYGLAICRYSFSYYYLLPRYQRHRWRSM